MLSRGLLANANTTNGTSYCEHGIVDRCDLESCANGEDHHSNDDGIFTRVFVCDPALIQCTYDICQYCLRDTSLSSLTEERSKLQHGRQKTLPKAAIRSSLSNATKSRCELVHDQDHRNNALALKESAISLSGMASSLATQHETMTGRTHSRREDPPRRRRLRKRRRMAKKRDLGNLTSITSDSKVGGTAISSGSCDNTRWSIGLSSLPDGLVAVDGQMVSIFHCIDLCIEVVVNFIVHRSGRHDCDKDVVMMRGVVITRAYEASNGSRCSSIQSLC